MRPTAAPAEHFRETGTAHHSTTNSAGRESSRSGSGFGSRDTAGNGGASTSQQTFSGTSEETSSAVQAIAQELNRYMVELVDQQKTAGADAVAGIAKAANVAARELDDQAPQVARLVRSVAASVDQLSKDIRSRDLSEVGTAIGAFGRRQPMVFLGSAMVAGYLLARYLSSDAMDMRSTTSALPPRKTV